ncbi:hypothetical protein Vadar_017400 [Vaccinium darrowii]|uniref:Uncharacterized protein n=1 Tax=Vaccinium darrowii TaxID=229202 RepID=A0ACB7YX60_9ERIC|nr:hypothetical protein Vadar_017400 [Vaccinium darrowii]
MEIMGTKDSRRQNTKNFVSCVRKLAYKEGVPQPILHILCFSDLSVFAFCNQSSTSPASLISLSLLFVISNDERRFSKMDHAGEDEQASMTIDDYEFPVSDSEEDSFASSVFEEFGAFNQKGLIRVQEGHRCYQMINGWIAQGMGMDHKNVAAVHKIPWSGPNGLGQLEAFHISSSEMAKKCGGNGNVMQAWYGGSINEICRIISHGFQRCRQSETEDGFAVCLYPLECVIDGLLSSVEDDYGLRHVLLCNVVLGRLEEVRNGSRKFQPSSNDFDSGVYNLSKPTKLIIWEAYMNSRIFPNYVVSFRPPNMRGLERVQAPIYKPATPSVGFDVLVSKLSRVLPSSEMGLIGKYMSAFRENKISRAQLIHKLRLLAGDKLLNDVITDHPKEEHREEPDHQLQQI